MNAEEKERGKLIEKPKKIAGAKMRSRKESLKFLIMFILGFIGMSIMLIITSLGYFIFPDAPGPKVFNIKLMPFLIGVCVLIVGGIYIYSSAPEIHGIWENGISNYYTTLPEKIKGRDFLPFDEISKVYYGKHGVHNKEDTEYLVLVKKGESRPYWGAPNFSEEEYEGDFYGKLKKAIKQKAPQAEWIKMDKRFKHERACGKYFKGKEL